MTTCIRFKYGVYLHQNLIIWQDKVLLLQNQMMNG